MTTMDTDHLTVADCARLEPRQLLEHLERTHHAFLRSELPRLSGLLRTVAAAHGTRHPELFAISDVFEELRLDLEPHLVKEERVLFPLIRQLLAAATLPSFACGTIRNPISVMTTEHDRTDDYLSQLRAATGGYRTPDDADATYRSLFTGFAALEADLELHLHEENDVLFPAIVALEVSLGG